jgi:hypothetical protein
MLLHERIKFQTAKHSFEKSEDLFGEAAKKAIVLVLGAVSCVSLIGRGSTLSVPEESKIRTLGGILAVMSQ